MKRDKTGQEFIADIRARQSNVVWPDVVINGRRVDEPVWKGSPNATIVQRIGMGLFGFFFVALGVVMLSYGKGEGSVPAILISWVPLLLGARLLYNTFRRPPKIHRET